MKNAFFDKIADHQIGVTRGTENIVPEKDYHRIVRDVFEDLSRVIAHTLGPAGGNTLITETSGGVPIYPTKDGFTVMNGHLYDNLAYESIYRCIRDVSSRMHEYVGDSTSSGIIWACDFYKKIDKYLSRHKEITPYGAGKLLKLIREQIENLLKQSKYIIDIRDMKKEQKAKIYRKIASVAANNDSEFGKKVADVYLDSKTDYPYISIKPSNNADEKIEKNLGFEFDHGYTHAHMANQADGISAEYDDPLFLLVDGPLLDNSIDQLKQYVFWVTRDLEVPRPLVIIASEYGVKARDFFTECCTGMVAINRATGQQTIVKLPVVAIVFNMISEQGMGLLKDIECVLGAKALQTNNGALQAPPDNPAILLQMLGRADHIKVQNHYTGIKGGGGSEQERKTRIEELQRLINQNLDKIQHGVLQEARIRGYQRRIGMLMGEMSIIYVGGDAYKQKRTNADIYDDAVRAVKCCIDNGITLGGNVAVNACIKNSKAIICNEVLKKIKDTNERMNVAIGITDAKLSKIIDDILDIVADSSKAAFREVFKNAIPKKSTREKIFKELDKRAIATESNPFAFATFDLIGNKFEEFSDNLDELPELIVPGNTDLELLKSVFMIIDIFLTSNQLMSLIPKR